MSDAQTRQIVTSEDCPRGLRAASADRVTHSSSACPSVAPREAAMRRRLQIARRVREHARHVRSGGAGAAGDDAVGCTLRSSLLVRAGVVMDAVLVAATTT